MKLDFLSDRHAVVGDEGSAELFVEYDVSAFGAECNFNGISEDVYARFECFSCIVSIFNLFSHDNLSPYNL